MGGYTTPLIYIKYTVDLRENLLILTEVPFLLLKMKLVLFFQILL